MEYAEEAGHDGEKQGALDPLPVIPLTESRDQREQGGHLGMMGSCTDLGKRSGIDNHNVPPFH